MENLINKVIKDSNTVQNSKSIRKGPNDKLLVEIESMLHDLEPRASLLLVNANTQPGNVSHFAKPCC